MNKLFVLTLLLISPFSFSGVEDVVKVSSYYCGSSEKFKGSGVAFNYEGNSFFTETFYFSEGKWSHSIFKQTGEGSSETIQDTEIIEDDNKLIERLGSLESDSKVIIASNSPDFILSIKI